MILYRLRCDQAHEFEGWFRDSAGYGEQAAAGLLECPTCGDRRIDRALMTPAVPRKAAKSPLANPETPPEAAVALPAAAPLPDEMRALLQRVRSEVEKRCDYVGQDFATEARRIHHGETAARPIYGETSPAQAEELADEGIEFARVPWVPRAEG